MDSLKRKQAWTIVSLAVAMFVIVAVVQYCMPMVNGREFSWGWVLTEWGALMYLVMGIATINGVSYSKYLYKVGVPVLFVLSLVGGVLEVGLTWWALLLAVLLTLPSVLIVMLFVRPGRKRKKAVDNEA